MGSESILMRPEAEWAIDSEASVGSNPLQDLFIRGHLTIEPRKP